MNSKDWREFARAKPIPNQKVLVARPNTGDVWVGCWNGMRPAWTDEALHWQPWADPEKPDPFEEWFFKRYGRAWGRGDDIAFAHVKEYWNAALEWRRQNPD